MRIEKFLINTINSATCTRSNTAQTHGSITDPHDTKLTVTPAHLLADSVDLTDLSQALR
jgi:hypothetical protein